MKMAGFSPEQPSFLAASTGTQARVYAICFGSPRSITEIYSGLYGSRTRPSTGRASSTVQQLLSIGLLQKHEAGTRWPKYSATLLPLFQELDYCKILLATNEKQLVETLFLYRPQQSGQTSTAAKPPQSIQQESQQGSTIVKPSPQNPFQPPSKQGSSTVNSPVLSTAFQYFRSCQSPVAPIPQLQKSFLSCLLVFAAPFATNSERSLSKPLVNRGLQAIRARLEAEKPAGLADLAATASLPIIAAAIALEDRTKALEGTKPEDLFTAKIARFVFGPGPAADFAREISESL